MLILNFSRHSFSFYVVVELITSVPADMAHKIGILTVYLIIAIVWVHCFMEPLGVNESNHRIQR